MTADQQLALWIAHPVLQLAVGGTMWRRKLHRVFPVFFAYLGFQILAFSLLFPMYRWGTYTYAQYFWFYWTCAAVNLVLGFMVIHEIFQDVFRHYHTLKDLGSVLFKWAALVMLLVAFVVAASSPTGDEGPIVQAIVTVQRCVRVAQVGLILFLMVFSRYLGASWKQHSFGISFGMGLAAAVELGTLAFHVSGHASEVTVHVINLVTYNLAIMIWMTYLLLDAPARVPETSLLASHRWERGLTDLQNPARGDSLIPMFESMVDRAFSRTHADYSSK
ncbi:MAG TPA: hypothetical protein VHS34_20565 [Terriglobales bacterium]|jgi:hypothetical protein|nr:hypothetical protein [Terriglobales bacterium]